MTEFKLCAHGDCAVEVTSRANFCIYHRGWHDALEREAIWSRVAKDIWARHVKDTPLGLRCECVGCEMGRALEKRST